MSAMLAYLSVLGQSAGPLFLLADGHHLSRPVLVKMLREALAKAGVESARFSGHSFSGSGQPQRLQPKAWRTP